MRASTLFLASLLASPGIASLSAQAADHPTASLAFSRTLRALDLSGDPGQPFVVVASTRLVDVPLGNGVVLRVAPDVVLAVGQIGTLGHAYVPIDATSGPAGLVVNAQALVWSVNGGSSPLPKLGTDVAKIELTDAETPPPIDPPREPLTLVDHTTHATVRAGLAVADGIPPMHLAVVDVDVPTGGHALRLQWVRHAGRFTRVHVILEGPGPDEAVTQAIEHLQVIAELGVWIGNVEVVVAEVGRTTSVGTR